MVQHSIKRRASQLHSLRNPAEKAKDFLTGLN